MEVTNTEYMPLHDINMLSHEEVHTHTLHTYTHTHTHTHATCICTHNMNMCTPTQNAATQNSPADLRSVDLYWRAPPPPNSSEEYLQLPQQIQFW